jgi:RimJ/RimL family protein N-acetyltransferase
MPISRYDKHYGGKGGAKKAHRAMIEHYGKKKGKQVFYAKMNKEKAERAGYNELKRRK